MAFKSLLFVCLMFAAMAAAPMAEAQLGLISGLLGLIRIDGAVRCSLNASTTAPVFPNALVQLQCGSGNVVSSATTDGSGLFRIVLDPLQFALSALVTGCNLVVKTPLSSCDGRRGPPLPSPTHRKHPSRPPQHRQHRSHRF